jgi:hypothetical protein
MSKRPSLFAPKSDRVSAPEPAAEEAAAPSATPEMRPASRRPPSREGKRVLSIYLDPLAWKQLRQLALDADTSTQALGEEAVNLLFAKHGINRSA